MKRYTLFLFIILIIINCFGQQDVKNYIPSVYSGILEGKEGEIFFVSVKTGDTAWMHNETPIYTLENIRINPVGNKKGLFFNFNNKDFFGSIHYGLYPQKQARYQQPVYFKKTAKIIQGKAEIDISILTGKYDIANWEKTGKAKIGYRITNNYGSIIYDGTIVIKGKGPFVVDTSIIAGPYVNNTTHNSFVIWFETNYACSPYVIVDDHNYLSRTNQNNTTFHEITINNLEPDTEYKYEVVFGDNKIQYDTKTAPLPGSRSDFTFAFTSDSRNGSGGGERNIYGVNAYIMKRMAALASSQKVSFFQFTGDMINGYSSNIGQTNLEYANWKKSVEPYWHYIPFITGMGNHEALVNIFDDGSEYGITIDKFPFNTNSAEAVFSQNFVNPESKLISEDNAYYDTKPDRLDFPKYGESVYYYTYDNIAMVVLNSNYWYTPSVKKIDEIGGNPHGYIMDMQLHWFRNTIDMLEANQDIDHIFVTIHTPALPNGGHANNDMWYFGNNLIRPVISGNPVKKGIIERRDEFLDIMINKSKKVVALLCGDEHNYSRTKITKSTNLYQDGYKGKKLKVSRPIWQITNGTAGAPYYGQEKLPWTESVEMFSTQYTLNLFDISGNKIQLRAINPETLEEIETIDLTP